MAFDQCLVVLPEIDAHSGKRRLIAALTPGTIREQRRHMTTTERNPFLHAELGAITLTRSVRTSEPDNRGYCADGV